MQTREGPSLVGFRARTGRLARRPARIAAADRERERAVGSGRGVRDRGGHWLTDVVAGEAPGVLSSRLGERLLRHGPRSERGWSPRPTLLLTAGDPLFFGVSLPLRP